MFSERLAVLDYTFRENKCVSSEILRYYPNEVQQVFHTYEPELHDFYAESGTYQICVGASSRDLRLTGLLEWQAAQPLPVHFTAASTLKQVMTHPVGAAIIGPILQRMAAAAGSATGKKDDDDSSLSMMMGIQLNTLIDFHVLTEEQLNGILSQINQA